MLDYLTNHQQRTKIVSVFSLRYDGGIGVAQGSTLGLLLVNILINASFCIVLLQNQRFAIL